MPTPYEGLRAAALEWDTIQRTRLALNNMLRAFERQERTVPLWLENPNGGPSDSILPALEFQEKHSLRQVVAAMDGDDWLIRIRDYVDATLGLGPAVFCIVGLLPPLTGFANPAKLWKYLGLHVLADHNSPGTQIGGVGRADLVERDTHTRAVGGRAPKRPTCGPICKVKDCPHDRWAFHLKSYAIARVVPGIVKCLASPYRPIYDARKRHTLITHPEWATENPKAPKLHYERDAQRFVAKRIWRDIWRVAHGRDIPVTQEIGAVSTPEAAAHGHQVRDTQTGIVMPAHFGTRE